MLEGIWPAIGLGAALMTSSSFVPQLIMRIRNPQAARMSYGTLACFMAGTSLWAAYGVHLHDSIIIGANIFVFCNLAAIAWVQYWQERSPSN